MAASFSIREYAASMRGTAASRHPLLGAGDFLPMTARGFRWWADELPAASAARFPPDRPRAPKKKRSVSDLSASDSAAEVDDASCVIKKRAKALHKKQQKRRSREDEDRVKKAHLGRRSGEEDQDGEIFGSTPKAKVALNKFNPLDSAHTSVITEIEHIKIQNGKINDVETIKPKKFENLKKKHKLKYIGCTKAINAQILRNSAKVLPLHSILKKYTKCSSVSVNKEKCSNSKGPEVIELCDKLVKHVTFSGVDDILSINKQSSKLPRLSLCKDFSDVLAASSSSTDNSDQADKFIPADSSAHMNKETSFEDSQPVRNISDGWSSESSSTKLPPGLIDLNRALPDSEDFNYPSIYDSELPNLEHAKDATCDSDFLILGDGREAVLKHSQGLPFNSQCVQCELSIYDRGRIIRSRSAVTLLPHEADDISDKEMASLPLNSRGEFIKFYTDYQRSSVRDTRMKGKALYAMPHHTVQYSSQHSQSCYTNLNQGNFHPTGREFSCYQCRNPLHAEKPRFQSDMNVQPEHTAVLGHTVRLMGKDLTVSTTTSKCTGEAAKEHTDPSIRCHHTTKMFLQLPRQGHPFLSLQSQSYSNILAEAPSTSQAYLGYRLHRFAEADVFSGNEAEFENRLSNFSYVNHGRNGPSRFPTLPDHYSLSPWSYSDPFGRPEPHTAPFLPTVTRHVTPSSVYHDNSTRPCGLYSANSVVHPPDGINFTYALKQPDNSDKQTTGAHLRNSSISSSIVGCMPRSGPVKLSACAKHVLEPSENTDNDNSPPAYSCIPFVIISRGGNVTNVSSGRNKVTEGCKL